ncbi:MAG: hypothetical protein DHS20C05_24530 [Hyphococcus sp.]|nr:MAG: hypothetical protein DHS20C05_24530 [Marinicaulis sp.]
MCKTSMTMCEPPLSQLDAYSEIMRTTVIDENSSRFSSLTQVE